MHAYQLGHGGNEGSEVVYLAGKRGENRVVGAEWAESGPPGVGPGGFRTGGRKGGSVFSYRVTSGVHPGEQNQVAAWPEQLAAGSRCEVFRVNDEKRRT